MRSLRKLRIENHPSSSTKDPPRSSLLVRYVFAWLRWYLAGQMRDPSRPDNALSFADWLIDHGFGELEKGFAFTAGMIAQLYGPLDRLENHPGSPRRARMSAPQSVRRIRSDGSLRRVRGRLRPICRDAAANTRPNHPGTGVAPGPVCLWLDDVTPCDDDAVAADRLTVSAKG
jgi:hypothetical protein